MSVRLDESDRERGTMTLLPDPEPREKRYTVISVDDHVIEPPDLFEGRMPAHLADRAPRIVEGDDGSEVWVYEDNTYPNVGLNAVVGRAKDEWSMEPARFDEMRRGCFDIHARIRDMDVAGIDASLCFPSLIAGFAGVVFSRSKDPELGLACLRAWNDWHVDVWAAAYPGRIIPLQIAWLLDPEIAADDVRRNAERGFRAVSFPEQPANIGLPSVHTEHWDPFFRACEETETVVCLHTGSAAWSAATSPRPPLELLTTLFPVNAIAATADWLWAGIPVRFPNLNIALSEGGVGWVPLLLDRLEYVMDHSATSYGAWRGGELTPSEAVRRNFWFCTIDDPSTIGLRHRIGVDHIMVETDYPHADSTWPDTQLVLEKTLGDLPDDEVELITWQNAARLFRWEVPACLSS